MTNINAAASNPAAELTEVEASQLRHAYWYATRGSGEKALVAAVERILAARLAAGGAATDEGLRARVEALAADFDRRWATMSVREVAAALHALADAAPAPTEDATYIVSSLNIAGDTQTHPAASRAADTAAEEPRTEAQTRLAEWREQIGRRVMLAMSCAHDGDDFGAGAVCATCWTNTQRICALIEADRLSRAEQEAGS